MRKAIAGHRTELIGRRRRASSDRNNSTDHGDDDGFRLDEMRVVVLESPTLLILPLISRGILPILRINCTC